MCNLFTYKYIQFVDRGRKFGRNFILDYVHKLGNVVLIMRLYKYIKYFSHYFNQSTDERQIKK